MGYAAAGFPTKRHKKRTSPHHDDDDIPIYYYHDAAFQSSNRTQTLRNFKRLRVNETRDKEESTSDDQRKPYATLCDLPAEVIRMIYIETAGSESLALTNKYLHQCLTPICTTDMMSILQKHYVLHYNLSELSDGEIYAPIFVDEKVFSSFIMHDFMLKYLNTEGSERQIYFVSSRAWKDRESISSVLSNDISYPEIFHERPELIFQFSEYMAYSSPYLKIKQPELVISNSIDFYFSGQDRYERTAFFKTMQAIRFRLPQRKIVFTAAHLTQLLNHLFRSKVIVNNRQLGILQSEVRETERRNAKFRFVSSFLKEGYNFDALTFEEFTDTYDLIQVATLKTDYELWKILSLIRNRALVNLFTEYGFVPPPEMFS